MLNYLKKNRAEKEEHNSVKKIELRKNHRCFWEAIKEVLAKARIGYLINK